ncbi:MAG TPA: 2-hydroxy-3-oxopropionate reductase [Rectinemataceae bacterium]|nr:2-hydroxy-3-oxopropionate reductase [Rectinemataceae bacterium]
MKKIGFIGLGIMGRPMAKNLIKAGYDLYVFDLVPAAVEELVSHGAIKCASVKEVAERCETIITMLPNSPHVKAVVLEDGGIVHYASKGALVIDMSSIAPSASIEMHRELRKKGIRMIDAPVSGGEPKAIDGSLAIMAGGDEKDFEDAKPLFAALGHTATLVGPVGSGNTCKLTNQIIVALNIAALSEGLMLAKKAGTDPQRVFDAIRAGLAGSTVMEAKTPMILADNFKPGFKIDLHIKDLGNAIETGNAFGSPLPLTKGIYEVLKCLSAEGEGSCDHSAIAKHYERLAGLKFSE